jgi:hypothetical protein
MAIVIEKCTAEQQRSVVLLLWARGLNIKDIYKEIFSVYGGKCLSRKAVHNWVANVSLMTKRLKWKWLRQQSKELYAVGFDALIK